MGRDVDCVISGGAAWLLPRSWLEREAHGAGTVAQCVKLPLGTATTHYWCQFVSGLHCFVSWLLFPTQLSANVGKQQLMAEARESLPSTRET